MKRTSVRLHIFRSQKVKVAQSCIVLPKVQVSDTTGDDSSNADGYKKILSDK